MVLFHPYCGIFTDQFCINSNRKSLLFDLFFIKRLYRILSGSFFSGWRDFSYIKAVNLWWLGVDVRVLVFFCMRLYCYSIYIIHLPLKVFMCCDVMVGYILRDDGIDSLWIWMMLFFD